MKKITGILFVFGGVVVNIPYALLISNFNYPYNMKGIFTITKMVE